jgi:hypothetical protein
MKVEVVGTLNERDVRREYDVTHPAEWGTEGLVRMTGVSAAVGAQLIGRHGRTQVGFCDVEEYFQPGEYLQELKQRDGAGAGVEVSWKDLDVGAGTAEPPQ